ncbi:hypothetical protein PM082_014115 [Marasmius tenuissimus]|nr:hypothetical protein PM082_014115 [Marasmius tenuissimus]
MTPPAAALSTVWSLVGHLLHVDETVPMGVDESQPFVSLSVRKEEKYLNQRIGTSLIDMDFSSGLNGLAAEIAPSSVFHEHLEARVLRRAYDDYDEGGYDRSRRRQALYFPRHAGCSRTSSLKT